MNTSRELLFALLSCGVKQREIAERAGLNQGTVSRILGGQSAPSWKATQRIMAVAGEFAVELSAHRDFIIEAINNAVDTRVKELTCNR